MWFLFGAVIAGIIIYFVMQKKKKNPEATSNANAIETETSPSYASPVKNGKALFDCFAEFSLEELKNAYVEGWSGAQGAFEKLYAETNKELPKFQIHEHAKIGFVKNAYVHNLFFYPVEQGGFGLPLEKEDVVFNSKFFEWCVQSISWFGIYDEQTNVSNYVLVYAKNLFDAGLGEYLAVANEVSRQLVLWVKEAAEKSEAAHKAGLQSDGTWTYLMKLIRNSDSFLYDKRLFDVKIIVADNRFSSNAIYTKYEDTTKDILTYAEVKEKIKCCYLCLYRDFRETYGLFKQDENGNPTDEYITIEDVLSCKSLKGFLYKHQSLQKDVDVRNLIDCNSIY